ncbi:MAG: oxidoreductase [Deltaproteobacteria bacterium HGW-Deltaproteobacteria-14]|nr:MAG: oxidoreductase [Deltaproteobacteria bacterium HGW-Deltaproteobacteria-14]
MTDLFSPLVFRNGARAANRCVLAAMTNQQSHVDGTLGEDEFRWLAARAAGGFGIVTTCASHVTADGQGWPGELACYSDAYLPGLTRVATMIRASGALSLVQLYHGGLRADVEASGLPAWTARVGPEVPGVTEATREGTLADIERVIAAFAAAARRVHAAGFDGVELHGAHGYLLTQFLSRHNDRSDGWGGDLAGRARLVREVMRAVRGAVPAGFLVGIRLSPEDWGNASGVDLDESVQVARWLCEDGADFIHLSLWRALLPSTKRPDAHPCAIFRAALPSDVPIFAAGGIWTRAEADALLAHGADAIAVARVAIGHPDWAAQLAAGVLEPSKPPFTEAQLLAAAVSPKFIGYLRRWRGLIAE